ncbi:MAG: Flagellar M-ring protein, partial [Pseudomonadota bacterium]
KEIRSRATSLTKRVNNPKAHVKQVLAKAAADAQAAQAAEVAAAAAAAALPPPDVVNPDDLIEIEEGESLEEIKARLKPKKPKISMELLNTANSYDDKVALLRFLVSEDSARVSKAIQNFIR